MADSNIIDKDNKLPNAQDFNFLRKEGITYIENLAGDVWTDYNTHDPGITLLEAMCYALTDLGYRTSFEVEDIIAPVNRYDTNKWKEVFYTARQVLPCNPLTLMDYRKLIIDTDGVKNAWVEMSNDYEVLIYLQKTRDAKQQPTYSLTYDYKKGQDVLHLRGLYKVFVEYEEDILNEEEAVLKERNREEILKRKAAILEVIWKKLHLHRNLTEDFISVTSIEYEDFAVDAVIQVSEGTDIEMINARIYKVINDFFSPPVNFYSLEQMLEKGLSAEEIFNGPVLNYGFIDSEELEKSERFKDIHLSDIINLVSSIEGIIAVKKFTFNQDDEPSFSNFNDWVGTVKDKQKKPRLDTVKSNIIFERSGDRHRDESRRRVNKERVNALFSFLKSGNFKTRLKDPNKDIPVPQGEFMDIGDYYPFQKNLPVVYGMMETFINEQNAIDNATIRKAIHELLIHNIGINGAKLFINLLSENIQAEYLEKKIGELLSGSTSDTSLRSIIDKVWEEEIKNEYFKNLISQLTAQPTGYTLNKDLLYNFVEQEPEFRKPSPRSYVLYQLAAGELKKNLARIKGKDDIARLNAAYNKYQAYLLEKRKKLVLQLRGFLMVFEQLLADYLSQLSHIRDIFSFDEYVLQTFYPQIITDINDLELLFIDFRQYQENHLRMIETAENFNAKRNDVLNHLLSRFGESMDKYSFFMRQFAGKEAQSILINDKINFLKDYVQISSYRAKGYDYADRNKNWDSDNVEGLKKRICRLLGIDNYRREKIAPREIFHEKITLDNNVYRHVVRLADPDNRKEILLESDQFQSEEEAIIILTYILEQGYDRRLYKEKEQNGEWYFELNRPSPENDDLPIARSQKYKNSGERKAVLEKVIRILSGFSGYENFHILDHILLRPKIGPIQKGKSIETVALLPTEYVPDVISSADKPAKEIRYKVRIVQTKDQSKNRSTWKLSFEKNGKEFLEAPEEFHFYKELIRRLDRIHRFASDITNYVRELTVDGAYIFKVEAGKTTLVQSKIRYAKPEDRDKDIEDLIDFLSYEFESVNAVINDNNPSLYADPYSFQLSVILPSWPRRFRDSTFKHLLEKTIYLETPSHIYPHVYWVNQDQMREFDEAYEVWIKDITQKQEGDSNEPPDTDKVNNLLTVLNKLRT